MAYLMGVDVSEHNSDEYVGVWNPKTSYNKGARFAIIKAGDGASNRIPFIDPWWERHYALALSVFPLGAYWFWRPECDPISQANLFSTAIKNKTLKIPLIFDVERNDYSIPANVVADKLAATLAAFKSSNPNKKVMIYTRMSFWNVNVATRSFWKDYYLFAARYPEPQPNLNEESPWWDGKYKPREGEWNNWDMWQATEELPGKEWGSGSSYMDGDLFNGDQRAFDIFIGNIVVGIPKYIYVSNPTGMNLIDITNGIKYGLLPQGTQLLVNGTYTDAKGIVWYKVGKHYIDSRYVKPLI